MRTTKALPNILRYRYPLTARAMTHAHLQYTALFKLVPKVLPLEARGQKEPWERGCAL